MKKQLNIFLAIWLLSTTIAMGQRKAEPFPEFITLSETEAQAEKSTLFQHHYKMRAEDELRLLRSEQDDLGFTHEKHQQYYKGVKVESAVSTLHSKNGTATMITGNYHRINGLEVTPQITAEQAFQVAKAHVGATHYRWEEPLSEHNDYELPKGELVVLIDFHSKNPPSLAYKFDMYASEPLYRANVFIDAHTGRYLQEYPIIVHANVPATGNSLYNGTVSFTAEDIGPYRLRQTTHGGGVQTYNLNNTTNYGAATDFNSPSTHFTVDNTGVQAHWATEHTHDYFLSNHGWNSYNGAGAILRSYVHYSVNYVNAFWDGSRMTYGDGNGGNITPLVTLDICGHEVAHGVTQFTAGLIYAGESGALNESFSDIFGEMVEEHGAGSHNWRIGDEIGILIRDMSNPNATNCPDTYGGQFWFPGGGVHTNSGVQNKWFFILTNGESSTNDLGNQYCVSGLGSQKAGAIAFRNLSVYLNPSSNYAAARTGAINAARDLYGIGSPEEVATTNAWHAVGVGGPYTPTITCPANIVQPNTAGICSRIVSYAAPTALANCPTVIQTNGLPSGSSFPVGVTNNVFRVTDAAGTTSTCAFTVTINDTQLPTINCPANITVNSPGVQCGANVNYATPTASDNCFIASNSLFSGGASGSFFPVGTNTVVWRAVDGSGNTRTCSFTITVVDTQLPTITCPANIVRAADPGSCGAVVNYNTPTANDNCGIQSVTQISGLPSGAYYDAGTVINVWRATDISNNTQTCSFSVTVTDSDPPVINCPDDIVRGTDHGKCHANIGAVLGAVSVYDNCNLASVTSNNPQIFQLGTTIVTWVAYDASNNSSSCQQSITIEDREWPYIQCPTNISIKTDEADCVATVDYAVNAYDNCSGVYIEYSVPPSSAFEIGYTHVEVWATDAVGHVSSCSFLVSVSTRPEVCNDVDDDCDGWIDEAEDWPALAKRLDGDGNTSDQYGSSVAIDGDYAIVGSSKKNALGQTMGSAFILFRDKNGANKWNQVAELTVPGLLPGSNFGASVAISGGVAAVGAPFDDVQVGNEGAVFVFYQSANNPEHWNFVKKVVQADPFPGDNFGTSVALNGDRLVVGSPLNDQSGNNAGAAYIFYRNEGGNDEWGQVRKLLAATASPDDDMGRAVAMDGDHVIVGAPGVDGLFQNAGAAYIFGRNHTGPDAWGQVARISTNQSGQNDNFGAAVDISGAWAIVGADRNDIKGADAGAAFLFHQNHLGIQNSWGQRQMLLDFAGAAGKRFGSAVGIDAPYAVVAAKGDNPFGAGSGRGFVYLLDGGTWLPVDQLADGGGQPGDALGSSAAISGRNIILGAALDDVGQQIDRGSVTIYGGLCDTNLQDDGGEERDESSRLITAESLHCYPVPFSGVLNIEIRDMNASFAQLTIVNALGQEVANLFKGAIEGDILVQWQTAQVPNGLYFLRLATNDKVVSRPIVKGD